MLHKQWSHFKGHATWRTDNGITNGSKTLVATCSALQVGMKVRQAALIHRTW